MLVSRLAASEDVARMTVLFSDKTGTITQNKLQLTGVQPVPMPTDGTRENVSEEQLLRHAMMACKIENKAATRCTSVLVITTDPPSSH